MNAFLGRLGPRTWLITFGIIVVLAAASVWWFGFASRASASAVRLPTSATITVGTQTLQETISGTGTLAPTVDDAVDFEAPGTVKTIAVAAGQTVKKGQTLGTVDTLTASANLADAKATLATAQAKLSDEQTASTGTAAELAQIASDESAVTVAQQAVDTAQTQLDSTTLTSPVAGLVAAVNVAVGDTVSVASSSSSSGSAGSSGASGGSTSSSSSSSGSSSSSSSTTGAFEIVGTNSWQVSIDVAATSIKNIKVGDQVTLSTTENPSFFGTVSAIGLLPSTTTGAATYPVTVDVTGSPADLYDGVSVTADIIYQRIVDAVAVPALAITTNNGQSTVTKVVNGKDVVTPVTTGITQGTYTQVTKGVAAGDQLLVRIARATTGTGAGATTGRTGLGGFGGFGTGTGTGTGRFGTGTGTGTGFGGGGFTGGGFGGATGGNG